MHPPPQSELHPLRRCRLCARVSQKGRCAPGSVTKVTGRRFLFQVGAVPGIVKCRVDAYSSSRLPYAEATDRRPRDYVIEPVDLGSNVTRLSQLAAGFLQQTETTEGSHTAGEVPWITGEGTMARALTRSSRQCLCPS